MKTQSITPVRLKRLQDLIELSNHNGREHCHGLRCHHIPRGQFTATYSDLALRWGVSTSVVCSTIKALVKMGYIKTERFAFATLFTILKTETEPVDKVAVNDTEADATATTLKVDDAVAISAMPETNRPKKGIMRRTPSAYPINRNENNVQRYLPSRFGRRVPIRKVYSRRNFLRRR